MRARLPDLARAQDVDSHHPVSPQASCGEFQLIGGLVVRVSFGLVAFFLITSNSPLRLLHFSLSDSHSPGDSTLPASSPTIPVKHWRQRWSWDGMRGLGFGSVGDEKVACHGLESCLVRVRRGNGDFLTQTNHLQMKKPKPRSRLRKEVGQGC